MGVVFKGGGVSGMRQNYAAPVPDSGTEQPLLDTATTGPIPGTIHLQAEQFEQPHFEQQTPNFMPTGTEVTPTDLSRSFGADEAQQDIIGMNATIASRFPEVFKGAPNDGTD